MDEKGKVPKWLLEKMEEGNFMAKEQIKKQETFGKDKCDSKMEETVEQGLRREYISLRDRYEGLLKEHAYLVNKLAETSPIGKEECCEDKDSCQTEDECCDCSGECENPYETCDVCGDEIEIEEETEYSDEFHLLMMTDTLAKMIQSNHDEELLKHLTKALYHVQCAKAFIDEE